MTFKGPMSDKLPCLRPICQHRLETRLKAVNDQDRLRVQQLHQDPSRLYFDFWKFVCDFDIDWKVIKCKSGPMTPIKKCLDETFKRLVSDNLSHLQTICPTAYCQYLTITRNFPQSSPDGYAVVDTTKVVILRICMRGREGPRVNL